MTHTSQAVVAPVVAREPAGHADTVVVAAIVGLVGLLLSTHAADIVTLWVIHRFGR